MQHRDITALVEGYYVEFARRYKEQILADRDPPTWASTATAREELTTRIAVEKEIFRNYFPHRNGLVLDLGCGFGRQALILARMGYHVTACDICQPFLDIGKILAERERLCVDFKRVDITKLHYQNQFFDYVLLLDSIEHLPAESRKVVLLNVSRVVKKNGLLLLGIPQNRSASFIRPLSFIRDLGVNLIWSCRKWITPGEIKITEEHPFPFPTINKMLKYLESDFNVINQQKADPVVFIVAQRK